MALITPFQILVVIGLNIALIIFAIYLLYKQRFSLGKNVIWFLIMLLAPFFGSIIKIGEYYFNKK